MRTFFAIDLPAPTKLSIEAWRNKALPPSKGEIPMANFHITLCFNGDTSEPQLDQLQHEANALKCNEFNIELNHFGYFSKPAIAFLGCENAPPELKQLNEKLSKMSSQAGLAISHPTYVPHVSLYRNMPMPPPAPLLPPQAMFKATKFGLYESVKHKHGVVYHSIFEWDLQRCINPGRR